MKVAKRKYMEPPPAMITPIGNGYMPLFSALLWIATTGFAGKFEQATEADWTDAYQQLTNAIASEKVKAMGWRGQTSEEIPAANFASCEIVRFWDGYCHDRATSGLMYLRGGFYSHHAQWIDNSDALMVGTEPVWKQIVVRKSDIAREWSHFPEQAIEEISELASSRPAKPLDGPSAVAPNSLQVQFNSDASAASVLGIVDLQSSLTKLLLVFQQTYVADERTGKTLENCTCLTSDELAEELGLDEVAVRKAISRLRQSVRHAYKVKHGTEPSKDILIQNCPDSAGYRINPYTRFVSYPKPHPPAMSRPSSQKGVTKSKNPG